LRPRTRIVLAFDENGGSYRARMIRKLGIDDLPALVKFPMKHGITSLD